MVNAQLRLMVTVKTAVIARYPVAFLVAFGDVNLELDVEVSSAQTEFWRPKIFTPLR